MLADDFLPNHHRFANTIAIRFVGVVGFGSCQQAGKLRRNDAAQNQTVTVNHKNEAKFCGAGRYAILCQGLPLERQIADLTKS